MSTQFTAEAMIEKSLGHTQANPNVERFVTRFWLAAEINGRKVESRGNTMIIHAASHVEANGVMRRGINYISEKIAGMEPKEANAAMPALVAELQKFDDEWQEIVKPFNE